RHTRSKRDWSSDVCSSDLVAVDLDGGGPVVRGWWARPSWSSEDRGLLHARPPVGQRSDWATAAARMLWRRGVRDWAEARRYYRQIGRASGRERVESATGGG